MRKKIIRSLALIVIAGLFIFSFTLPEVYSEDIIRQYDRQIEQAKQRLENLQGVIAQSRRDIERSRAEKDLLIEELDELEWEISLIGNELMMIQAQEELLTLQYTRLLEESRQIQLSIDEKEQRSHQLIVTLYKNYMFNYTALLLSSKSINEIIDNSIYLQYLFEADKNYFRLLREEKEQYRENQIQQVELHEELYLAKSKAREKETRLKEIEQEKGQELLRLIYQEQRLIADIDSREREYEETERRIREITQKRSEELRRREVFDSPMGPVIWPTTGRVVSGFGMRRHPIFGTNRMHTGIDIDAPAGTPVVSVAEGYVIYAGWLGGYGNTVMVQHDNQHATLYAHLRSYIVHEDQKVEQRELIGYVGSTGWSTGPHLHFEVRVNNEPVNPMNYLPR